ncbi:hypothetical protein DB30_06358 [Enhygromyxa salina]|uniref:Uncharacterized protein n=1 Tax=Enhygromyxa salina TaxID=215803 RepID=A0A0C2D3U2_9BACT|nr:hypothetical protein DB30_06358 [Enhygromyxa salina]
MLLAPPQPQVIPPPFAEAHEYVTHDGHRTRWASVTYTLPSGETAEVVMVADDAGGGDGYIYVDGETLVHTSMAAGALGWSSNAPGADALALVALDGLAAGGAAALAGDDALSGYCE